MSLPDFLKRHTNAKGGQDIGSGLKFNYYIIMEDLNKQEQWVLPLDNSVVFPKMKTKIAVSDKDSLHIKNLIDTKNNYIK